jgi:hypothetical protein
MADSEDDMNNDNKRRRLCHEPESPAITSSSRFISITSSSCALPETTTIGVIFPKLFELHGFLSTLDNNEKFRILPVVRDARESYRVLYKCDSTVICFKFYVVNLSDIEFSFELGKILPTLREKNDRGEDQPNLCVFLLGTAGASHHSLKLGRAFHVTHATKVDRGEISYSNEAEGLVMKPKGFSHAYSNPNYNMRRTLCTNHLMHCGSESLDKASPSVSLMDMETYEFFRTCELNKVGNYQCFRLVSDRVSNDDDGGANSQHISDVARKCIKFDALRDAFFDFIDLYFVPNTAARVSDEKFQQLLTSHTRLHSHFVNKQLDSMAFKLQSVAEKHNLDEEDLLEKVREYYHHHNSSEFCNLPN